MFEAIIAIVLIIVAVLIIGFANYLYQRNIASRITLPWYDPENVIDINGIKTHVLIKGEGEPLVLVHGSQMNLYDWRHNVDFFAKHFKVYAFDMVGCGFTDKPRATYTPDYFADFINSYMEHYEINEAAFVASSWGGGHVFQFAIKHPEKVKRLVMSSTCGMPHKMTLLDRALAVPVLGNLVMLFGNKQVVRAELRSMFHDKSQVQDELVDSVYKPLFMPGGVYATIKSYQNADFSFVRSNLEAIRQPVLLIWGRRDIVHQRWMMDEMDRRIPDCKLHIIENVGHQPHEEAPEEFNQIALRFLRN